MVSSCWSKTHSLNVGYEARYKTKYPSSFETPNPELSTINIISLSSRSQDSTE